MTESPSLLLQRAAELIEQRAVDATDGPWRASGYEMYSTADAEVVEIGHEAGGFIRQEDAVWSAMLNPTIAAPLVAWLRKAADDYKSRERLPKLGDPNPYGAPIDLTGSGLFGPSYWETALEFARLIVGEPGKD